MAPDKQTENRPAGERFASGNTHGARWQPGQSGNPKGRPKGVTLSDALRKMLAEQAPGKTEQTYAEVIARALCKQAVKGNVLAAKEVADRVEGRPKQSLDVDLNVRDWRKLAEANGLREADVLREARQLIAESADDLGGSEGDRAASDS